MGKIFNTLRYGKTKLKIFLVLTMLLFVVGIAGILLGILLKQSVLIIVGAVVLVVALIQLFSKKFRTTEVNEKREPIFHGKNYNFGEEQKQYEDYKPETEEKESYEEEDEPDDEESEEETDLEEDRELSSYLDGYNEQRIERILKKYKVKCEHVPVVIDLCQSEKVRQCPAYMWFDRREISFLLLEEEPRMISFKCEHTPVMTYEKGVMASPSIDYEEIRKSTIISELFENLLPTCYEEGFNNRTNYRKNLYVLEPDIKLTNRSVKNVIRILNPEFRIKGLGINTSEEDVYVEEAFKAMVLWKDAVYTMVEYKEELKKILGRMSEHGMSYAAFKRNVESMVRMRIITREYAEQYVEYAYKDR